MRRSRLPPGGGNVLEKVREKRAQAAARGQRLIDLSIGEPKGPALPSARQAASRAVLSEAEAMHSYQYNASPGVPGFSERFVGAHVARALGAAAVDYLPIPGIKPILGLVPLACGCALRALVVGTMTRPGYPIPADWCAFHPRVQHYPLRLDVANAFRFSLADVQPGTGLLMLNYPHNPSGQVAARGWLGEICAWCAEHDVRLFNDAAYCILSYAEDPVTLSEVAVDFPELSWAEAFTAAKLIGNGTGWHVGAMVGSPDFIADLKEIKGKTDTGFCAPMAAGALAAFESDRAGIDRYRQRYRERLSLLAGILTRHGMRIALEPASGFFTLWQAPARAFGRAMESAEAFNFAMIDETGVVGVHFGDYLRYAVCANVAALAEGIDAAFAQARVAYG